MNFSMVIFSAWLICPVFSSRQWSISMPSSVASGVNTMPTFSDFLMTSLYVPHVFGSVDEAIFPSTVKGILVGFPSFVTYFHATQRRSVANFWTSLFINYKSHTMMSRPPMSLIRSLCPGTSGRMMWRLQFVNSVDSWQVFYMNGERGASVSCPQALRVNVHSFDRPLYVIFQVVNCNVFFFVIHFSRILRH